MSSTLIGMNNAQDLINRAYLQCEKYQWAREVMKNAIEGHATKMEFGVEWQALKKDKVYRRLISDNGDGMSKDELFKYFKGLGDSGSKKVKSADALDTAIHSNFGLGCRISLLPFNKAGIIYLSYQKGVGHMIKMKYDEEVGGYVIAEWDYEGVKETIINPEDYNWLTGVDWSKVAPDWVRDHGTCVILLGDDESMNTFAEAEPGNNTLRTVAKYLNTRFFEIPIEVRVVEFNFPDRDKWPKSESDFAAPIPGKDHTSKGTTRICRGAKYYITEAIPQSPKVGNLKASGTVTVENGRLDIHWFLWSGDRVQCGQYAPETGFIAVKYGTELYGASTKVANFRNFGIYEKEVRDRLTIILEPKLYMQNSQWGIFPDQSRTRLVFSGNGEKSVDMPISQWGLLFLNNMPKEIREAIKGAQSLDNIDEFLSVALIKKLLSKIGDRYRHMISVVDPKKASSKTGSIDKKDPEGVSVMVEGTGKIISDKAGDYTPYGSGSEGGDGGGGGYTGGSLRPVVNEGFGTTGSRSKNKQQVVAKKILPESEGKTPTIDVKANQSFPVPVNLGSDCVDKIFHVCAYAEHYTFTDGHIGPAVLMNTESPIIVEAIKYHQESHHESFHDEIKKIVLTSYGALACCKVAHALKFTKYMSRENIKEMYLTEEALTLSLLGLAAEDAFIAPKLGMCGPKTLSQPV